VGFAVETATRAYAEATKAQSQEWLCYKSLNSKSAFMSTPGKASGASRTEALHLKTSRRTEWVNITAEVSRCVAASGVTHGVCHIYIPHTTAGVTINEGDDPDVARDMEAAFDRMVPRDAGYKHYEGNSDSHIKATLVGSSQTVWIENGRLRLGTGKPSSSANSMARATAKSW
jgi:secondary thiamine-phosphate synthase enzyme